MIGFVGKRSHLLTLLSSPAFVGLSSFGARPAEAGRPLAPKDDESMKALSRPPPAFVGLIPKGLLAFHVASCHANEALEMSAEWCRIEAWQQFLNRSC